MNRAQKADTVENLGQIFADSGVVVVAHYAGITVAQMQDFRSRMKQAGGNVRVAKNTLARIAVEGKPCEGIKPLLKGQTVLAYSEDPVAAAKVVDAYAKENAKLVVLGGAMGEQTLDSEGVKSVAKMPSREEMIASIVGCIGAPASNLASAIGAPASNIAGVLQTLAEKETEDA